MPENIKQEPHTVGLRTTLRAIQNGEARLVYMAEDADVFVTRRVQEVCTANGVEYKRVASMKDLGRACGIASKAACAALLKHE